MNHSSAGGEGYDRQGMSLLRAENDILNRHLAKKGRGKGPENAPFLLKGDVNDLKARVEELAQEFEDLQKCVSYQPISVGGGNCIIGSSDDITNTEIKAKFNVQLSGSGQEMMLGSFGGKGKGAFFDNLDNFNVFSFGALNVNSFESINLDVGTATGPKSSISLSKDDGIKIESDSGNNNPGESKITVTKDTGIIIDGDNKPVLITSRSDDFQGGVQVRTPTKFRVISGATDGADLSVSSSDGIKAMVIGSVLKLPLD